MKKQNLFLILIIILLLSSGCSSRYDLESPSLLLQYYEYPNSWGGIVLGQSSWDETVKKLESMDFVEVDSISRVCCINGIDYALYLNFAEEYRENELKIWFIDGKAQALVFSGYYTLAEIQHNLGDLERFIVYGWRYEKPMMDYYGYSSSAGYLIDSWPTTRRNLEEIEKITLSENSVFRVKLVNPDQLMYLLEREIGMVTINHLIMEDAFEDWHGYGEYEVFRPKNNLFSTTIPYDE